MQGWAWEQAGDSEGEGRLNIAILSGKGGTGKTTISTNLSVITVPITSTAMWKSLMGLYS